MITMICIVRCTNQENPLIRQIKVQTKKESQQMKYRIYIDETGNPDLDSSDNPNHRFLSLAMK